MVENKSGKLIIVGDLFPIMSNYEYFIHGDVEKLFGKRICNLFETADYRICNLEGALTDTKERGEKTGPSYIAPTSTVKALHELGINCCVLANNHVTDAGHQGVVDTMHVLDGAHITNIGAGENVNTIENHQIIEMAGRKVCIYNVAEQMYNKPTETAAGVNLYDEYVVCKELVELKSLCDYLIVLYHGGIENYRYPSPEVKKRFHRMVDSGADMVLSQHTHCIGCEEYYRGSYLLYGQGNFLFKVFEKNLTDSGLILEVTFGDEGVNIEKHKVIAVENCVRYAEDQNFDDLYQRSEKILNDAFLKKEFQNFASSQLFKYIDAFKGKDIVRSVVYRLFPKKCRNWYREQAYKKKQIMFVLHTLRSEQNRETAISGLEKFISEFHGK